LEGIIGASVVKIVAQTSNKQGQDLQVAENSECLTVMVKDIAEMGNGNSMVPVVVRLLTIPFLHHQQKPGVGEKWTGRAFWRQYSGIRVYVQHYLKPGKPIFTQSRLKVDSDVD
jgi:hypothetical protein